ncbi:MAG TPA: hypothetical protein VFC63_29095 [Blastocatellia bacterium]|nr:hypothetical protein [Blastocatellia bacterium]
MRRSLRVCSTVLMFTVIASGIVFKGKTTISARIIAYRPSDTVMQGGPGADVPNQEAFLMRIESIKQGQVPTIIKVEYRHYDHTDITDELLQNAPLLRLKVTRNASCDQTYDQFVSTAPVIREKDSQKPVLGGIAYVDKFKDIKPSAHYLLKCYTLQKGDFEVVDK